MKIMMSAGEASGDLHGGALAAELKKLRPDIELFGMGGSDMQKSGVRIIYDINNLGIIGVVEVVKHIPFFFRLRDTLKQAMIDEKPDALVCIDYPGFNMRLAHVAKELGIPVIYYIAPTIWAWNKGRAKKIVRDVAAVASIFPFEAKAYKEAGANVTFVAREINKKAPSQFFIPRASTISLSLLHSIIGHNPGIDIEITEGARYDLMGMCDACIASSGTATLETALMELPTVLVYRLAPFTWFLAKHLVHVKYAGLPNLLLQREVTPELLQDEVTPDHISSLVLPWLLNPAAREANVEELRDARKALGNGGAVRNVASLVLKTAGDQEIT